MEACRGETWSLCHFSGMKVFGLHRISRGQEPLAVRVLPTLLSTITGCRGQGLPASLPGQASLGCGEYVQSLFQNNHPGSVLEVTRGKSIHGSRAREKFRIEVCYVIGDISILKVGVHLWATQFCFCKGWASCSQTTLDSALSKPICSW